jgi:flagellar biosynthesis/type III secretory pathway protein FliH
VKHFLAWKTPENDGGPSRETSDSSQNLRILTNSATKVLHSVAEFQRAITVVEAIAAKTEDRIMYDQRLKAQRDYQWGLDSAREEGRQEGRSLAERTIGELSEILADLQQRLRSRES